MATEEDDRTSTDGQLAQKADSGLRGQGAIILMMARLKDSIVELNRSTTNLNRWLITLTFVLLVVTIAQIYIYHFPIARQMTLRRLPTPSPPSTVTDRPSMSD